MTPSKPTPPSEPAPRRNRTQRFYLPSPVRTPEERMREIQQAWLDAMFNPKDRPR